MAIDSFECKIITGGYNRCDSSWNKSSDELDRCFKIYNPVKGEAVVISDGVEYTLESGKVYLISGFSIDAQKCSSFMNVYWLHFVPVSIHLKHILLNSKPIHVWDKKHFHFLSEFDEHIKALFTDDSLNSSNISNLPYSYEEAKIQSYILSLVAEAIKDIPTNSLVPSKEISKLTPSIKFMDGEFKTNPSLKEIASKSNLAPNYFHRIFKQNFEITPYNYMLRLRMEYAVKLLTTTNKSVKEVAFESGYNNEFYFYRQFKKQYNYSPGRLKKIRPF